MRNARISCCRFSHQIHEKTDRGLRTSLNVDSSMQRNPTNFSKIGLCVCRIPPPRRSLFATKLSKNERTTVKIRKERTTQGENPSVIDFPLRRSKPLVTLRERTTPPTVKITTYPFFFSIMRDHHVFTVFSIASSSSATPDG